MSVRELRAELDAAGEETGKFSEKSEFVAAVARWGGACGACVAMP